MLRFLAPLVQRRTYLATVDLVLDLAFAVVWFSLFTTLVATGASLLVTLVGLPILTATFYLARGAAAVERARARTLLGVHLDAPTRRPPKGAGLWQKLLTPFRDRTTWKELFYLWLVQPVQGLVNFTVTVTAWAVPLWAITLPLYVSHAKPELWNGHRLDSWHRAIGPAIIGLILLPVVPWIIRGLARADAASA